MTCITYIGHTVLNLQLHTETEIRQRIGIELQRATQDRHHAWRTPVLATVGTDGQPQARTVVLRQADTQLIQLQIYTDYRSPKVAELAAQPQAALTFWSARLGWQLRVRVRASVQQHGPEVDAVWAKVRQSAAAGDYLSARAPGDVLPTAESAVTDTSGLPHTHHLAVVTAQIQEIDWLELGRSGHRRAVFSADRWAWRVP